MNSLDTNQLVRILTRDDEAQASRAAKRLETEPFWVGKTVLLEAEWVLRHAYDIERNKIGTGIRRLLGLPGATVEDPGAVRQALDWHEAGMDFGDALHLASSRECARFLTFDQDLIRRAAGLQTSPPVEEP